MKKLIMVLSLMLGGIAFVNAQEQQDTTKSEPTIQTTTQDQDRQIIQVSELPESVKASLESQDYSGWAVSAAYRSSQKDFSDETKSMEVYVIEMKNGTETKTVRFDKDGKKLEDEKKDQK